MAETPAFPVNEDMTLQRRLWRFQKCGRVFMALFIFAAFIGLLGRGGPASQKQIESESLELEYQKFVGRTATTDLHFQASQNIAEASSTALWLDNEYLKNVRLEAIRPQPEKVETQSDRTIFHFHNGSAKEKFPIVFHVQFSHFGRFALKAGIGEETLQVTQMVYP